MKRIDSNSAIDKERGEGSSSYCSSDYMSTNLTDSNSDKESRMSSSNVSSDEDMPNNINNRKILSPSKAKRVTDCTNDTSSNSNNNSEDAAIHALNAIRYGPAELSRIELNSLAALCCDMRVFLWLKHQSTLSSATPHNSFRDDGFTEKFRDFSIYNNSSDVPASVASNCSRPGNTTTILNPFSSTASKEKKKQRTYYGFSDRPFDDTFSYPEPGALALHVGCKVQIVKDNREGVVTCEKAGGWREVKFDDGSIERFRPSALRYTGMISDGISDSERETPTAPISNNEYPAHHSSLMNTSQSIHKQRFSMHDNAKSTYNESNTLTSFNLQLNSKNPHHFHSNSHFSAYHGKSNSSHSPAQASHKQPKPAASSTGLTSSQSATSILQESNKYQSFTTASPLKNGTRVVVLRTGVEGFVVSEKLGGWRTLRFADGSTSSYRPSDLALVSPLHPPMSLLGDKSEAPWGDISNNGHHYHSGHNNNSESASEKDEPSTSSSGVTDCMSSDTSSNNDGPNGMDDGNNFRITAPVGPYIIKSTGTGVQ